MSHSLNRWGVLDRWFVFLAGQLREREIFRWLYQHRKEIFNGWFIAAAICSAAYLKYFFSYEDGHAPFFLTLFRLVTSFIGLEALGDLSMVIMCVALGALTPVALVLAPLTVILLPLFMAGLAMWAIFAFTSLVVLALAPAGLIVGGRALFEHYAARWLAEAGQREAERRAVYAALGLNGGASRTVSGGHSGLQFQHAAQPMDEDEAAAFTSWGAASMLLGRVFGRPFFAETQKHILLTAGTRGGKGRDLIVPNLKLYEGGVFVLDPKGENAQQTAKRRAAFGDVFALDPFGVSGLPSVSFNPLAKMRGDSMIAEAQTLADALIIGDDNDYFASSARQLLVGVILHVVTAPEMPARDLPMVRRLLMRDLSATLKAMTESQDETVGALLRDVGEWGLSTADREWSGIRNSAIVQLKWLAAPEMEAVLQDTGGTLDFSDYLKKPMSVFVCLPAPMFKTYNRWLRLVVSSALDAMTARLAPPPLPVRFILDEVAQLGTLSSIESALTLSAGYGVQLWGIWQHIGDIKRCYPSSGIGGWVSSSGVRMCFSTNDNETCAEFSKQAGGVFTPDQIARLSSSDMLVLLDGQNPAIVQRDAKAMVEEAEQASGGAVYEGDRAEAWQAG